MPRRPEADELSLKIGQRVAQFRKEFNLTLDELGARYAEQGVEDGDEGTGNSKGHLSNLERGLVRPTIHTLQRLADAMGIDLVDLVVFPADSLRQQLIDRTRDVKRGVMRKVLREIESSPKVTKPVRVEPKKVRHRVTRQRTTG